MFQGRLTKLSLRRAELRLETPVPVFSNLEVTLTGNDGKQVSGSLFCKVIGQLSNNGILLHFTSMSPDIEKFIKALLGKSPEEDASIVPQADSIKPAAESSTLH
jgi:hypothetical protein